MKKVLGELRTLGFSHAEALLWRALLELGEGDIAKLSRHAAIPRSSTYNIIEKLRDRGLVNFYEKKKRRMYVAVPPERLVRYFTERAETAQNLLPELRTLRKHEEAPHIIVHHGAEGMKEVLGHIIEKHYPISAVTSLEDMSTAANRIFTQFIEKRIAQKLQVRLITNVSPSAEEFARADQAALRETRFVPGNFQFHTANYIFGDYVAILSLRQAIPIAVSIYDKDIAATFQMYFDLLWQFVARPNRPSY